MEGFLPCVGQGAQVLSEPELQGGDLSEGAADPSAAEAPFEICVPSIADFSVKPVLIVIKALLTWQRSWSYTTCYLCLVLI